MSPLACSEYLEYLFKHYSGYCCNVVGTCPCTFSAMAAACHQLPSLQAIYLQSDICSVECTMPCCTTCRHEYGEAEVTLELVESMDEAIDHLHANGSGHTECIVTGRVRLHTFPLGGGGGRGDVVTGDAPLAVCYHSM